MNSENTQAQSRGKSRKRLYAVVAVVTLLVVIILIVALIPAYISSSGGTDMVMKRVSRNVDGTVSVDDLSVGWFRGVRLKDLSYLDDKAGTSLNVESIISEPDYFSLLMGKFDLGKTVINNPRLTMTVRPGPAKPAKPNGGTGKTGADKGIDLQNLDLKINDGKVTFNMQGPSMKDQTVEFINIGSHVKINPPGSVSAFDLAMTVAGPVSSAQVKADGKIETEQAEKWKLKGAQFNVNVDNLELERLRPLFALMGKDFNAEGKLNADMDVDVSDNALKRLKGTAKITNFAQTVAGKKTELDKPINIDADITTDNDQLNIDRLDIESSFCKVNVSGGLDAVDYTADADLAGTSNFVSQFVDLKGLGLSGTVQAGGKMTILPTGIETTGTGNISSLKIMKNSKSTPVSNSKLKYTVKTDSSDKTLNFKTMEINNTTIGDVRLGGSTLPMGKDSSDKLDAEIDANVALDKALQFASVFVELPDGMILDGRGDGKVNIERKNDGYRISTGGIELTDFKLGKEGMTPFSEKQVDLKFDITVNPEDKTWEIDDLYFDSSQIKIPGASVTRKKKGDSVELAGQLNAEYDLAAVSSLGSAFLPASLELTGQRQENLQFSSTYPADKPDQMLANLSAVTDFGFDSASFMGLNFAKTSTKITIDKGKLAIEPFETVVNDGKMRFGATADLAEEPPMLKVKPDLHMIEKIKITQEMTDKMLKYVNPIFVNAVVHEGYTDFQSENISIPLAKNSQNLLYLKGTFAISGLSVQSPIINTIQRIPAMFGGNNQNKTDRNTNMEILPTAIELKNGVLRYDDMQLNIERNPFNFSGRTGLNDSMEMTVRLPYAFSDGKIDNVYANEAGRKDRIKVPFKGSLKNPRLDTEKLIEMQFKDRLKDEINKQIQKGLKDLFN